MRSLKTGKTGRVSAYTIEEIRFLYTFGGIPHQKRGAYDQAIANQHPDQSKQMKEHRHGNVNLERQSPSRYGHRTL